MDSVYGMDSNAIEIQAVCHLTLALSQCKRLQPDIPTNNTDPSWDGGVYLHEKPNDKSKKNLRRIPVQVKGKASNNLSKEKIKFSADVSDLENYLRDGGAIYFVVYLPTNNKMPKIFYEDLTPVKLMGYLKDVKEKQKKKSIELRSLPSDTERIENIFANFYEHSKNQASFSHENLCSFEDLKSQKKKVKIVLYTYKINGKPEEGFNPFFENQVYAYVVDEFGMKIPLSDIITDLAFQRDIHEPIIIDNKTIFEGFTVTQTGENLFTLNLGAAVTIGFNLEDTKIDFQYTPCALHRERLQALRFFSKLKEHGHFLMGTHRFNLNGVNGYDIDKVNQEISFLERLDKLLTVLHVSKQVDLDKITPGERRIVEILYKGIVEKQPTLSLDPTKNDKLVLWNTGISNVSVRIIMTADKEQKGLYRYEDLFHSKSVGIFLPRNDEGYCQVSPFAIVTAPGFATIDNIDWDNLVEDIANRTPENDDFAFEQANYTLLHMLGAFDGCHNKRIIETAINLAKWLLERKSTDLGTDAKLINLYQAVKRLRDLKENEKRDLWDIVEKTGIGEDVKTAAYLLLEQPDQAKRHWAKVEPVYQESFKSFPIYHFGKGIL